MVRAPGQALNRLTKDKGRSNKRRGSSTRASRPLSAQCCTVHQEHCLHDLPPKGSRGQPERQCRFRTVRPHPCMSTWVFTTRKEEKESQRRRKAQMLRQQTYRPAEGKLKELGPQLSVVAGPCKCASMESLPACKPKMQRKRRKGWGWWVSGE